MDLEILEIKQEPDFSDYETTYITETEIVDCDFHIKDEDLPEIKQEEIDEELLITDETDPLPISFTVLETTEDIANSEQTQFINVDKQSFKKHKKNGMVKCTICQAKFFSENTLELHIKTHSINKVFNCEKCYMKFRSIGELMLHQKAMRHFKQTDSFEEKVRLLNKRKFRCPICKIAFYSSRTFQLHYRSHSGQFKYGCGTCNMKFGTLSDLARHREKSTHDLVCKECGTVLNTNEEMEQHKKMHMKWKFFKCPDCNFSSVVHNHFRHHRLKECKGIVDESKTNEDVSKTIEVDSKTNEEDAVFDSIVSVTCLACKDSFHDTQTYLKHDCQGGDIIENIIAETETIDSATIQEQNPLEDAD